MIELANKGKSLSAYVDDIFQMIEYICKVAGCIGIVLQINFVIAILAVIPCIVKNVVNYFNIKESNRRFQIWINIKLPKETTILLSKKTDYPLL